jgi:chorismate dehydratase
MEGVLCAPAQRLRSFPMNRLRVSVVEYLNTAPLVWGFTHGPLRGRYDLRFAVPSECAEQLRRGEVDLGIIPVIEYPRMAAAGADLVILPEMAVSAKNEVRSLLVIARRPVEYARRFALDASSRSTQALVRILCAERWKIAPEFFEARPDAAAMLTEADAALIIGDPALRIAVNVASSCYIPAVPGVENLHVYDVAAEWRALTGLPCVLAMWVGRREAVRAEVAADFLASKAYGLAHLEEIAAAWSEPLKLPAAELERYLRENVDYGFDHENRRGLQLYFAKAAALGLIAQVESLEMASQARVV